MPLPKAALLIHYYFPPIHSIGVVRNFKIAQQVANHITNIQVLTTSNRNVLPKNKMEGADTFNVSELETKDYRSKLKAKTHYSENQKSSFWFKFGRKLIDTSPFNIWIGEGGATYIKNGIQEGRKFLNENPKALIYTSFRPYADFYIAAKLKEEFPDTKWIADYRDLHVDPLYDTVFLPNRQKKIDKLLLRKADLVTTVSKGLKRELTLP